MDPDLRDRLHGYELALARRDATAVEGDLIDLLADDFLEFGRSGRVWTRATIAPSLRSSPDAAAASLVLEAFDVALLAETVVLVTYRAAGARRSSIWIRREGRWRMRFHQGTPIAEDEDG